MRRMFGIVRVVAVVLAGCGADLTSLAEVSGRTWRISRDNPPVVTCDADAPEPMRFAQTELRRYLGQILAIELPASIAGASSPQIQLRLSPNADVSEEGFEFRGEGNVLCITGRSPLGVVFGTYEFLRRFGGCRFSDLGPDGEYVPRRDQLMLEGGPIKINPKLWYRGEQFVPEENWNLSRQRLDWMAKNGLNFVMYCPAHQEKPTVGAEPAAPGSRGTASQRISAAPAQLTKEEFDRELLPELRKRGLKLDMNLHNLLYWLPPGRYLAEHPEWYALMNGKRGGQFTQLCLCTTNREGVATLIKNVKNYLHDNPDVEIVGVIPEDGFGMCQCERCVATDADPQAAFNHGGVYGENRSKAARYHRLLNEVAHAIGNEFPHVKVGGAAYVDLMWPASDVRLAQNTTIWLALYWRDYCRPLIPGKTSSLNQRFIQAIQEWKQNYTGKLLTYEYTMGRARQTTLPHPIWEVLCRDWPALKALGVEGATLQCWSLEHSAYALNNLAFARAGWQEEIDPDQLLDDYLLGAFGSVKDKIRPVFKALASRVRQRAASPDDLLPEADNVRFFVDEDSRRVFHEALASAQRDVANDRERRQVEKLSAAVRYWELSAELFELRADAERLKQGQPDMARRKSRQAV